MTRGHLVLDAHYIIIKEYRSNLFTTGQPTLASSFLKWVLTNHTNKERCSLVSLTPKPGASHEFAEFPCHPELDKFDPSDRVFVAVAATHPDRPPILEATDSKWWGWREALRASGIRVVFLCPEEVSERSRRKARRRR
ncbi:MAG: hypothetical protein HYX75_15335 [Acidobacteria bacterium]|nr:hypothetical protein [Acidobacteriota bacterium]